MRPVTRLWTMIDCLRTSALRPVFRLRSAGVFLIYFVCFYTNQVVSCLSLLGWVSRIAGRAPQRFKRATLPAPQPQNEQGGEGQRLILGKGEFPAARARTRNHRVHASQFTLGKITSRLAADRAHRSVNAIGARRVEAAVSIVQREDHHFYVVRNYRPRVRMRKLCQPTTGHGLLMQGDDSQKSLGRAICSSITRCCLSQPRGPRVASDENFFDSEL